MVLVHTGLGVGVCCECLSKYYTLYYYIQALAECVCSVTNASVELKRSKEGSGTFCAVFAIQISFKSVAFPFSNSFLGNNMGTQLGLAAIYIALD